jgi:hypothetical protein
LRLFSLIINLNLKFAFDEALALYLE